MPAAARGAACVAVLLSLLDFCLSIAEIVMGGKHLDDCPVQTKIPVYLLVAGCCGLVLSLNNVVKSKRTQQLPEQGLQAEQQSSVDRCINFVLSLMSLFAFIWVICGMVWIFGAAPTYEFSSLPGNSTTAAPAPSTYCYRPLHVFAKVSVLLRFLMVMLYCLIICCTCCACCGALLCMGCFAAASSSDEEGKEAPQQEAKQPEKQEAV